jgi:hypothetical protein
MSRRKNGHKKEKDPGDEVAEYNRDGTVFF